MALERFVERLFLAAAVLSAGLAILILCFMVLLGLPILGGGGFWVSLSQPWVPNNGIYGILPMIVGTLSISTLALVIGFPISLGCAMATRLFQTGPVVWLLKRTIQLMTAMPTVVYGFVGIFLLVPLVRDLFQAGSGMCILSASLLLSVLISPTMILFFIDSFDRVPGAYLQAAKALGASPVQELVHVILPCAGRGMLTGVVLSLGRAVGDTLIALMIAGNAVAMPASPLDSARTLTAHIALVIAADFDSVEFRTLFSCGIVLYGFTLIMVGAARKLSAHGKPLP